MGARRIVGGIIVALLSLVAMALFIVTLYIPHINGRIQQVSSSVILEPYGADLKFYLTRGTATNDYGEEVWNEDPYGSDIGSALVFGRCPDALDDLRLVRRLIVACTILCGASAGLAIISMFFCGKLARCSSLPMFFSFLTSLAAVGLMAWVAALFFTVYDDHRDCLSSFGADGNFSGFDFSGFTFAQARAVRDRKFRSADIDSFIYNDSNKTGTEQFYYLRSNGNVEYFESILTPQYQEVYTNLTSDQQFQFRRAVAVGAIGDIRVNNVRLAQGPRVLIAAWAVALISVILAIIFLCVFCCCPHGKHSSRRNKHGVNKNRSPSEVVTHTTITHTTTDFPPQLYTAPANPQSSIDHDFHNPNVAVAPTHFQQEPGAQAPNPRSPMYVDVQNAAFPAGSSTTEPVDQPYTYNGGQRQRGPTAMPEERVMRGNPHNSLTYFNNHQQPRPQHPLRPMPLHVVPSSNVSHERSAISEHPTLLNITRQPSMKRTASSMTPLPIGYLSISSPTSHRDM